MRGETLNHPPAGRTSGSLAVRGGLARTFGSLVGFLVVSFLCCGIYILADAFANPINASAAAVICAAFAIAMGAILLFYLLKQGVQARASAHAHSAESADAQVSFFASTKPPPQEAVRNNLAYHRSYIDHSRIRQ